MLVQWKKNMYNRKKSLKKAEFPFNMKPIDQTSDFHKIINVTQIAHLCNLTFQRSTPSGSWHGQLVINCMRVCLECKISNKLCEFVYALTQTYGKQSWQRRGNQCTCRNSLCVSKLAQTAGRVPHLCKNKYLLNQNRSGKQGSKPTFCTVAINFNVSGKCANTFLPAPALMSCKTLQRSPAKYILI